jgi:hypothetical protein
MILPPISIIVSKLNGAPFKPGDEVHVLSGAHRGQIAVVTRERPWPEDSGVQVVFVKLVAAEKELYFRACELCRERGLRKISNLQ